MGRFPKRKQPIQEINGNLYIVHAEYPEDRIKNAQLIKEWLGVTHAFRVNQNGTMIFCELIEEPEWENIT